MTNLNHTHLPSNIDYLKWYRLAIVLARVFLIPLDFNIVNVSAPLIRMNLNAPSAQLQLTLKKVNLHIESWYCPIGLILRCESSTVNV